MIKPIEYIQQGISELGFKSSANGVCSTDLGDGFVGLVLISKLAGPEFLRFELFIGVYWDEYEELKQVGWKIRNRRNNWVSAAKKAPDFFTEFLLEDVNKIDRLREDVVTVVNKCSEKIFGELASFEGLYSHNSDANLVAEVYPEHLLALDFCENGKASAKAHAADLRREIHEKYLIERFDTFCARVFSN